jgi:hypothetical protein
MSQYGDESGRYLRPMAVDGDIGFVEVDSRHLADEAKAIFDTQWGFANGDVWAADLDNLPETFIGRRVVRTARELAELARIGAFAEIEEIYRDLYE